MSSSVVRLPGRAVSEDAFQTNDLRPGLVSNPWQIVVFADNVPDNPDIQQIRELDEHHCCVNNGRPILAFVRAAGTHSVDPHSEPINRERISFQRACSKSSHFELPEQVSSFQAASYGELCIVKFITPVLVHR